MRDLLILYGYSQLYNIDVFWYFVGGDLNCVKKDNLICAVMFAKVFFVVVAAHQDILIL